MQIVYCLSSYIYCVRNSDKAVTNKSVETNSSFHVTPRYIRKGLVCAFSQDFEIHLGWVGGLNHVVNSLQLSSETVLGCGIQHLGTDPGHGRRPEKCVSV